MATCPVIGVDVGASKTVACRDDGELLRNELGGHGTASLVGYSRQGERQLGEAAVLSAGANLKGTAMAVGRLATLPHSDLARTGAATHWAFAHSARADGAAQFDFDHDGDTLRVPGVGILGALLAKVRATSGVGEAEGAPLLSLAVPPIAAAGASADDLAAARKFARAALADAAAIGGWKLAAAPLREVAAAAALARKYPKAEETSLDVLVLDVGAAASSAYIVRLSRDPDAKALSWAHELVGVASDAYLGTADFDCAVFEHFAAQVASKHGVPIVKGSRAGARLLSGCERLRTLCSTLPEAKVPRVLASAAAPLPSPPTRTHTVGRCRWRI